MSSSSVVQEPNLSTIPLIEKETCLLPKKERIIKLVHAVALVIFSLGFALFFESVRQMLKEAWTGKTIKTINTEASVEVPIPLAKKEAPKKSTMEDITLTFQDIEEKTALLSIEYTETPRHHFSDILCPEKTVLRVGDRMIHGNWVEMPDGHSYIATQAPHILDHGLFWKAAFENDGFIVDITTLRDGIRPYYPTEGVEFYTESKVEISNSESLAENFTLYTYQITVGEETREVQRLHFSDWKDFDGTSMETLDQLVEIITEKLGEQKTPIIHCRAGVGRTGTLISVITLRNLLNQGKISAENINERIEQVIMQGRKCRGPAFVQNTKQFDVIKAAVTA